MTDTGSPWSPYRHLREQYPEYKVHETELPPGVMGAVDRRRRTVWLDSRLTFAERRSTLAHEIGHLELGLTKCCHDPDHPLEMAVEGWAGRKLIPPDALAGALNWSPNLAEVAEELSVDEQMLRTRLRTLTDQEQDMVWALCHRAWETLAA